MVNIQEDPRNNKANDSALSKTVYRQKLWKWKLNLYFVHKWLMSIYGNLVTEGSQCSFPEDTC